MKLLIDAHVFDRKFQGVRTYLEGLYTHMICYKDIDFYFAANNEDRLKNIFGDHSNVHYVHLSERGQLARLIFEFPKIIERLNIDYAHFQYISPIVKKCKEIVTIHDLLFLDYPQYFPLSYRLKFKYLFKRSAYKADLLMTVSDYSRQAMAKWYGLDPKDIFVTYNSVLPIQENIMQIDVKSKYNLDKYILTVSRIEPRKNHLALLKAYNELMLYNKGYKLVFVGGQDIKYTEFFNYYNNIPDNIKTNILFLQVPFEDLTALYRNASLFVFPSFAEGFGIPPIEAIVYGCNLICSNATAMSEFGFPSELYFNPYDIEELKQKMMTQLNNSVDRKLKSNIMGKYDWNKIAHGFYNKLKE